MITLKRDDVFDFVSVFLFFQLFCFLSHEFLERLHVERFRIFAHLQFGIAKSIEELLDFFLFVVGVLPANREWKLYG